MEAEAATTAETVRPDCRNGARQSLRKEASRTIRIGGVESKHDEIKENGHQPGSSQAGGPANDEADSLQDGSSSVTGEVCGSEIDGVDSLTVPCRPHVMGVDHHTRKPAVENGAAFPNASLQQMHQERNELIVPK